MRIHLCKVHLTNSALNKYLLTVSIAITMIPLSVNHMVTWAGRHRRWGHSKDKRSEALQGLKKPVPFQLHGTPRLEKEWKEEAWLSLPPAPSAQSRPPRHCLGTTAQCVSTGIASALQAQSKDKNYPRGAWVAQSVECPTLSQVLISRFEGSSPASGSVLTAQSLEPVSDSVSPFLSTPFLLALCFSLSFKINKH